uniref:Uncharacterized protein n=1 Tax=Anguilla anguilla TaxID=7936 RepID=A0A0E9T1C1_ANGAN
MNMLRLVQVSILAVL